MKEEIQNQEELSLVAKGAGIFSFGYVFEVLVVFFTTVFLTRILGVNDFGLYSLGLVILQGGAILALFGLNNGALKYISAYLALNDKRKVKGTIIQVILFPLIFGSIISVFVFLFSSFIANFFGKPELSPVIKVFSLGIPLFALMQSSEAVTRSFKTVRYKVLGEKILKPFLNFLFVFVLYLLGYRLLGMAFAFVLSVLITVLFIISGIKKIFPLISLKNIAPEFETRKLFSTSSSLMLIYVIIFLLHWIDISMVGYFLASEDVGIYQVAVKVSSLVLMSLAALNAIFIPTISSLYHKEEKEKLSSVFKTVTRWGLFLGLLILLVLVVSPKEIMMIFGSGFVLGISSLLILCFGQLIYVGIGSSGNMLIMTGKEKIETLNDIGVLILDVVLNLILIPKYGILGAAIATAFCLAVLNILRVLEVYLLFKVHPFSIKSFKGILSALFAFIIAFPLKYYFFSDFHYLIDLFLTSFVILISFSLFLIFFKFEKEDKFILKKIKERLNF
jgi:O-antigen/teichoic acid export membrane protein